MDSTWLVGSILVSLSIDVALLLGRLISDVDDGE